MRHPIAFAAAILIASLTFAQDASFIRVSKDDPRYLETTDGKPYIPIGLNFVGPPHVKGNDPRERLAELDQWMGKLARNGGNHMRVWLSNDFYEVEPRQAGVYDPEKVKQVQAMMALATKHGIRVKMTIEHFREIDPAQKGKTWAMKTLHHKSQGGTADTMAGWVASAESRKQFVGKIDFLARYFKDEPAVYGWELWNEMNAIRAGDYMGWTVAMLPELHRAFPKHLCMQSLGSHDHENGRPVYRKHTLLEGNDVSQVHRYLDLGASWKVCGGPVDLLAAEAVRDLLAANPGRPVMLAESGAVEPRHTGPFKLYAKDTAGTILHDVLFAAFFAGAAGSGQCWHWDHYVHKNDLWWQFGRFAQAVKGIDPRVEKFEPIMIEHPRLRVYVLKGQKTILAWCRDKKNDWQSELERGEKPEKLAGESISFAAHLRGFENAKVTIYDPWADRWGEGAQKDGAVALPGFERSIVIRIAR